MKVLALYIMSAALAFTAQAAEPEPDPVASFKVLVASFPTEGIVPSVPANDPYRRYSIYDVRFDVRKTESLVAPLIAVIDFSKEYPNSPAGYHPEYGPCPVRLVFHWEGSRWKYDRIYGWGKNMTGLGFDSDHTTEGPLADFLRPLR
jgi:hypothetical protein